MSLLLMPRRRISTAFGDLKCDAAARCDQVKAPPAASQATPRCGMTDLSSLLSRESRTRSCSHLDPSIRCNRPHNTLGIRSAVLLIKCMCGILLVWACTYLSSVHGNPLWLAPLAEGFRLLIPTQQSTRAITLKNHSLQNTSSDCVIWEITSKVSEGKHLYLASDELKLHRVTQKNPFQSLLFDIPYHLCRICPSEVSFSKIRYILLH